MKTTTIINTVDLDTIITAPKAAATPKTAADAEQYTAAIVWSGTPVYFGYNTAYTATATVTAKNGYTFDSSTAIVGWDVVKTADNVLTLSKSYAATALLEFDGIDDIKDALRVFNTAAPYTIVPYELAEAEKAYNARVFAAAAERYAKMKYSDFVSAYFFPSVTLKNGDVQTADDAISHAVVATGLYHISVNPKLQTLVFKEKQPRTITIADIIKQRAVYTARKRGEQPNDTDKQNAKLYYTKNAAAWCALLVSESITAKIGENDTMDSSTRDSIEAQAAVARAKAAAELKANNPFAQPLDLRDNHRNAAARCKVIFAAVTGRAAADLDTLKHFHYSHVINQIVQTKSAEKGGGTIVHENTIKDLEAIATTCRYYANNLKVPMNSDEKTKKTK
jgi:hypothetical protein